MTTSAWSAPLQNVLFFFHMEIYWGDREKATCHGGNGWKEAKKNRIANKTFLSVLENKIFGAKRVLVTFFVVVRCCCWLILLVKSILVLLLLQLWDWVVFWASSCLGNICAMLFNHFVELLELFLLLLLLFLLLRNAHVFDDMTLCCLMMPLQPELFVIS